MKAHARSRLFRSVWILALLLGGPAAGQEVLAPADAFPTRLVVHGGKEELGLTPLNVALKKPMHPGSYVLRRIDDDRHLNAMIYQIKGTSYFSTILDRVSKDRDDTYDLKPGVDEEGRSFAPGVTIGPDGFKKVMIGPDLFTIFEPNSRGAKPYLFPLIGPTGVRVTRAYPMEDVPGEDKDHPHQRSFWFTHGKVNGIDFWSEQTGHGTIRERQMDSWSFSGPVALVRTVNEWRGPDGKPVCEDERIFHIYGLASPRILDFDITIRANHGPVTFGDTKEGTFGVRVASSMDANRKGGGKITNAEGITNQAAWGKASAWVDYTGPVEGKTVGIAILNHPESFRYPTTWHVRDYGLFAANPFGWHDFGLGKSGDYTIPDGESIRLRYRVILHEGSTESAKLPAAFRAFAEPPAITIGNRP